MRLCSAFACRLGHDSEDGTERRLMGKSLNTCRSHCLSVASCICLVLPSQGGTAVAIAAVGFVMCVTSLCVSAACWCFTLPALSLSLAASMVDNMLPLLNWTFISVGRSKGRDHFVFIVVTINLPSEIFIYPWEIVDSDEYSPDYNGVFNNNYKKKKNPGLSFSFKAFHDWWLGIALSWPAFL